MAEEGTQEPTTLKDGEVAIAADRLKKFEADSKDMMTYKREKKVLAEKVDDLEEKIEELGKVKPGGEPEDVQAAVDAATSKLRKDFEKTNAKALEDQATKMGLEHAARLRLTQKAGDKALDFLPSIDLSEAVDVDAVNECVDKFLENHPEIAKGATAAPDPGSLPVNNSPGSGTPPPAGGNEPGPQTASEREKVLQAGLGTSKHSVSRTKPGSRTPARYPPD